MKTRQILITLLAFVFTGSILVAAVNAESDQQTPQAVSVLENVRDYAPSLGDNANYLIDGGSLYKGDAGGWFQIQIPDGVIASVIASRIDNGIETLYMGAANEMVLYRSQDGGDNWEAFVLDSEAIGGITAIAVDSFQKIVYVGTDTNGAFRLRDVGSSMTANGHLILTEPVLEIATDRAGSGLAFVRTSRHLYRAENMGLSWVEVDNLLSFPTGVVVTDKSTEFVPATVYVGTTDRGLLRSDDGGFSWQIVNAGLNMTPGTRLFINALATDPVQSQVLYVSTSYLFGSTTVSQTPGGVYVTANGGQNWQTLGTNIADGALVDDLLPVSGVTGAVYALSTQSREPFALGDAPAVVVVDSTQPVATWSQLVSRFDISGVNWAWLTATLSALILMFIAGLDFISNRRARSGKGSGNEAKGAELGHILNLVLARFGR